MTESIEVEVGELYANLHEQYSEGLGEQYEERVRQNVEDFLHNFNQQVERQQEAAQEQEDLDLSEEEAAAVAED